MTTTDVAGSTARPIPFHVVGAVRALRPRKEQLREVILPILDRDDCVSAWDLAHWIRISPETLTRRHLGPLVAAGRIERRFSKRITHPEQSDRPVRTRPSEDG